MRFAPQLDALPEWSCFYTVDELDQRTHDLAERYPDKVSVTVEGHSRERHPIRVLRIGNGKRNALFYACPHPNEPIGSVMADHLAELLCTDDELLAQLDTTFHIIKCIDPDGTKLNEGWFKGPFTVENYARNFFRPAGFEQVEWTFPVDYKTLHFDRPLPETQVLMKLIEELRPDFLYSLHNAGFGGVYAYITREAPDWCEELYALAKRFELPLSLGEPEMPYAVRFADAVYRLPSIEESYDYLAENTDKDPAEIIRSGASSFGYASRFCNPFTLVCELPYFYDPRIDDLSESDVIRRDAVLNRLKQSETLFKAVQAEYDKVSGLLSKTTSLRTAVENFMQTMPAGIQAERTFASKNPEMERKATVAELFDSQAVHPFYHLLLVGMVLRVFDAENRDRSDTVFGDAWTAVDKIFKEHHEMVVANLDYKVIPIRNLVGMQLGAGLEALARL